MIRCESKTVFYRLHLCGDVQNHHIWNSRFDVVLSRCAPSLTLRMTMVKIAKLSRGKISDLLIKQIGLKVFYYYFLHTSVEKGHKTLILFLYVSSYDWS